MKFTLLTLFLGGLAAVSAQTACSDAVAAIPTCGSPCITSAASAIGCPSGNYACQCAPSASAAIINAAIGCVIGACGIPTAIQVSSAANAVCTACAV